jgi:hypothetical protein
LATFALIAAAAWVVITLIVLAICRAATRDDKPEGADAGESLAKPVAVGVRAEADGGLARPSAPGVTGTADGGSPFGRRR